MNHDQIVKQSKNAYKQWAECWRKNASFHKAYPMNSFEELRNTGIGKGILCAANGYSLEENMETIKKYADNVDVFACDKTLGHLLDNGIKPTYCIVTDANVSYEKYMKPYEKQLEKTILLQNVCGNTEWTKNGNWKDKYFYVNKDVMNYEKEFMELSGCTNAVTAGTNVSNMMIVLLSQSDNEKRQMLFGYDKMILIGFDYSWREEGHYYAYDKEAAGKFYFMRHIYGTAPSGKLIYTSNNLSSSASWLNLYINAYKVPVVQCSQDSLMPFGGFKDLATQMQYRHKPSDSYIVKNMLKDREGLENRLNKINNSLRNIAREHWFQANSI